MANILLAEDDLAVRDFVRLALEMDNHHVVAVYDGTEALERLLADPGKYDLLITDIKMPVTDGLMLMQKIVEQNIELPTVLMTGYADQQEKVQALSPCVKAVVLKPFTLEKIREDTNTVLSNEKTKVA